MEENPLKSLETTVACDPRDWSIGKRDAWIYGIVCGWDDERGETCLQDEDPMTEVAALHRWTPDAVARLRRLRSKFLELMMGGD